MAYRGGGYLSWTVMVGDSYTGQKTFGYLAKAKEYAKQKANETGISSIIIPSDRKAGKTHHVYPDKKKNGRQRNPKTIEEVRRILYRMYIGQGKTPQQAIDLAQKNGGIYHAAVVAKEAYDAGASKETAIRKALGSRGLKAVQSGELTAKHLREIRTSKRNPMMYGTSYFTSKGAAERYYKNEGGEGDMQSAREAVNRKLREGTIHIGKPPLQPGQRLTTTDGGKRYMIVENPMNVLKANPRRPVRVKIGNNTYPAKAKVIDGKVKIFVTPDVARKVNPGLKLYRIEESSKHIGGHGWVQTGERLAVSGAEAIRQHRQSQRERGNVPFTGTKFRAVAAKKNHEFHIDVDSHNAGRSIKGNPRKKEKTSASVILNSVGGGPDIDFHSLTWDQVSRLTDWAKTEGYQKPKNASGSRARYFYQKLLREVR